MYISWDTLVRAAAVLTAALAIAGFIWGIQKWVLRQNGTKKELADLHKLHREDTKTIKDELCILSYSMLAALDGLKQQGCNGNVTKAYEKLEKHLNQQAHDQL